MYQILQNVYSRRHYFRGYVASLLDMCLCSATIERIIDYLFLYLLYFKIIMLFELCR